MRLMTLLSFSRKQKELQDFQTLSWCCSVENLEAYFCIREKKNISRLAEIQYKVMGFVLFCFDFFILVMETKELFFLQNLQMPTQKQVYI